MKFIYPPQLPISAQKDRIEQAVRTSQVVIVQGQTGSGKTTQIPKMLLEMGFGSRGKHIAHTQPRRIAARSVAERICEEIQTRLGDEIGYQVRFDDRSTPTTRLCVMTDGILLAQIQRDPQLRRYDAIIIDEAHERSLNIDFLLGYLTELLPRRRDLRLIVTSATIDAEKFQKHFEKALGKPVPVIEVSGRTYPVTILYEPAGSAPQLHPVSGFADLTDFSASPLTSPLADSDDSNDTGDDTNHSDAGSSSDDGDMPRHVARAVAEILADSRHASGPRDVLIFAAGQRDIRDYEQAIRSALPAQTSSTTRPDSVEIIPLYARLSAQEQHRIFEHHTRQRIIIATNVAETSLTVPDIRYVVDPGLARIARYSKSAKVQRLPIEPISQASANQRAGRTGRVADGVCIRLYSQEDFLSRPEFTDPEILRTSLGHVVLHMLSVGVAHTAEDVTDFGFIDPPDTRAVSDGITELNELGALSSTSGVLRLTPLGRHLARIPIDDRLGRMILEAGKIGTADVLACVLVIVAFLSLQDPRERPEDKREEADQLHQRYSDPQSDFLTILNIWDRFFGASAKKVSNSQLRKKAKTEFFNYLRLRQWRNLVSQLRLMCRRMNYAVGSIHPIEATDRAILALPLAQQGKSSLAEKWDSDAIHRSILAGLLSNMGHQLIREPKASDFAGLKGAARARAIRRAKRQNKNMYQGARGTRFGIFPASPLSRSTPEWVMTAALIQTNRLWAHMAAKIDPAWALPLAGSLTRTTYSPAHWSAQAGAALATKTVLLYGLPIVSGQRVQWSRINPVEAHQFLLRQGMVEDGIRRRFPHDDFLARNRRVLETSSQEANMTRRVTQSVNDEDLFAFYDRVIPSDVTNVAELGAWWRRTYAKHPHLCDFNPDDDVLRTTAGEHISADEYPSIWYARTRENSANSGSTTADDTNANGSSQTIPLRLSYAYTPGKPGDGVSVHIPLRYLNRIDPTQFTWLVPGMRHELILGIIKALPKQLRVQFVPAPDSADTIDAWIEDRLNEASAPGLVPESESDTQSRSDSEQEQAQGTPADQRDDDNDDGQNADVPTSSTDNHNQQGSSSSASSTLLSRVANLSADEQPRTLEQMRTYASAQARAQHISRAQEEAPYGSALTRLPFARVFALAAITTRGAQILPHVIDSYWNTIADYLRVTFVVEKDAPRFDRPRIHRHSSNLVASFGTLTDQGPEGRQLNDEERNGHKHSGQKSNNRGQNRRGKAHEPWKPEVLASGKSLTALQHDLADQAKKAAASSISASAQHARQKGHAVASATILHTSGATTKPRDEMIRDAALAALHLPPARITSRWLGREALALSAAPYPSSEKLADDMQRQAIRQLLPSTDSLTSDTALHERVVELRDIFEDQVYTVAKQTIAILSAQASLSRDIGGSVPLPLLAVVQSLREHSASLVYPGFIGKTPATAFEQLPRFLRADSVRLEKAKRDRSRDVTWAWQADQAWAIVTKAQKKAEQTPAGPARDEMMRHAETTRWLYEEFRVSLWAQELGVQHHPSIRRLEKTAAGQPLA